jgi:hypothetical protein
MLEVEHLEKIEFNKDAFKSLHLESDKKDLIQALVTVHTSVGKTADVIEGKGNGLIILLHGGPGKSLPKASKRDEPLIPR